MLTCLVCGRRPVRQSLADERGELPTVGYMTCQQCSGDPHAAGCNDLAAHEMPAKCTRVSTRQRKPAVPVKLGVELPRFELPMPMRLRAVTRGCMFVELERFIDRMLVQPSRRQGIHFDARLIGQSADGSALYDVDIVCGESS